MSEEFVLILINFLVIPLLVELYRLIVNQFNFKPSKLHITIVLSAVAIALSYTFGEDFFAGLPPFGDNFFEWLVAFIDGVGALIGAAVILYNTLYDKFFDAIGSRVKLFSYRLRKR
jgi:hypothetical protein